jgi:hypothetical protein
MSQENLAWIQGQKSPDPVIRTFSERASGRRATRHSVVTYVPDNPLDENVYIPDSTACPRGPEAAKRDVHSVRSFVPDTTAEATLSISGRLQ